MGNPEITLHTPKHPRYMPQVRSDCPPARLLEFLAGEAGLAANEAAESVASSKAEEEALLEQVGITSHHILLRYLLNSLHAHAQ